jgi:hypothetical protein
VSDIYICSYRRSKLLHFDCLNKSDQNQAKERKNLPKGKHFSLFFTPPVVRLQRRRREIFSLLHRKRKRDEGGSACCENRRRRKRRVIFSCLWSSTMEESFSYLLMQLKHKRNERIAEGFCNGNSREKPREFWENFENSWRKMEEEVLLYLYWFGWPRLHHFDLICSNGLETNLESKFSDSPSNHQYSCCPDNQP